VSRCWCFALQRKRTFYGQYRSICVETAHWARLPRKLRSCWKKVDELHLDGTPGDGLAGSIGAI
jgi:hypothetical protein